MRGLDPRIHHSSKESFEADGLPGRSPAMTRGGIMSTLEIRPATEADLAAVTDIYAHAVLHGTATFELIPPNLAEMTRRFESLMDGGYPWLVATLDGRAVGYAYAGPYRPRPAYRFTVENSIYLAPAIHRRGIGAQLLQRLIAECEARGCRQMIAVVGDSANAGSIGVHRRCGFAMVGTHPDVGFKFGRWLDIVMMQRALGEGAATLPEQPRSPDGA
jgi:L-amino acid N-acyltransferase YncA